MQRWQRIAPACNDPDSQLLGAGYSGDCTLKGFVEHRVVSNRDWKKLAQSELERAAWLMQQGSNYTTWTLYTDAYQQDDTEP